MILTSAALNDPLSCSSVLLLYLISIMAVFVTFVLAGVF